MDWDEEEQGPSFDEHEEEEQQPPKPKRQRGTTGGRSKQHKSQKQLRREAEEEEERRRAEEKEKESWGPTRRKELMPYPVLSQADESATPFTPFARSIKAPVLLAELEAHAGEVKAHIEQANNPAAPTAVDQSHILHHAIRKERWEAEKSKRDKEKRRLRKERKRQREMAVDQLMREQGMAKAQAQAIVDASKAVPRTTESMRVYTETLVAGDDAEALAELQQDEMSSYFDSPEGLPKVLITSSISPSNRMRTFMNELQEVIPSSRWYLRRRFPIKMILDGALERGFTDMILINEDKNVPHHLVHIHLPEGPTAYYKLSSIKYRKQLPGSSTPTNHFPELILTNFNTRLGHSLGRMLASLFPKAPDFEGRRVVTFHNQRDFIFFRHHRYIFESAKEARLQECGPRFTMKLEKLQEGIFDPRNAEFQWVSKPREQGKQKKHQHL